MRDAMRFGVFRILIAPFLCFMGGCKNSSISQAPISIIPGWEVVTPERNLAAQFKQMNKSEQNWTVSKIGEIISITDTGFVRSAPILNLKDTVELLGFSIASFGEYAKGLGGYVTGLDFGEFGGGLFFVDSSRTEVEPIPFGAEFIGQNLLFVDSFNGRIFALCGLAHLSFDTGYLVEVERSDSTFYARIVSFLPQAPSAAQKMNDSEMVYVDGGGIRKINISGKLDSLSEIAIFSAGYPSSVVYDQGDIFVGMKRFVAHYDAKSKSVQLIEPIDKSRIK